MAAPNCTLIANTNCILDVKYDVDISVGAHLGFNHSAGYKVPSPGAH